MAFIKYGSIPNTKTIFKLFIPLQGKGSIQFYQFKSNVDQKSLSLLKNTNHNCKNLLIAEDNSGISNMYVKNLSKRNIPYGLF